MIATLRQSGKYFVTWRVLNAMHFGIPQNRPRVFIVGLLRSAGRPAGFGWPKPHRRPPLPLTRFLCGGAGVLRGVTVGTAAHDVQLAKQFHKALCAGVCVCVCVSVCCGWLCLCVRW